MGKLKQLLSVASGVLILSLLLQASRNQVSDASNSSWDILIQRALEWGILAVLVFWLLQVLLQDLRLFLQRLADKLEQIDYKIELFMRSNRREGHHD